MEDPHSSEIIIQAKYKKYFDSEKINRLTMSLKNLLRRAQIDIPRKKTHEKVYNIIEYMRTVS